MDSELPFAGATSFETEESTCGNQWMCGKHISSMYSFFAIYLLLLPIIVSYYIEGCILRVHCIVFSPLSTENFPFFCAMQSYALASGLLCSKQMSYGAI